MASVNKVLLLGAVLSVAIVGACATESSTDAAAPSDVGTAAPAYRLEIGKKPSSLEVYVSKMPTHGEAEAIIADLQRKFEDKDDGYFVSINCSAGGTRDVDNRLGNGKFAIGAIGAARTGLDEAQHEVALVDGGKCPPDPLPTAAPAALTAQQVVDAISAAGLPVVDPRDNSSRICQKAGCVQLVTTDYFSVYQFPDVDSAAKWASIYPSGYLKGTVFLRYTEGGSHPTDPALIPRYNAVLDGMQTGN
ncbi:hypothetical protein [Mycolicibacterium alvei]|uniref:DUF5642 domain-containing protein n=1 Tax=Mycolicibacterium alvei TaxID=67081 RepID=A0A6N4V4J8_9MYCO|nr:hypothetical protein [Mycolicibacterium alvei]MCV7003505.1 hypothetical protein [Mycolicibacterium alvei]BBX30541.1 hypothetical protein MALV_56660 [Mycolicibacterium alvei]